MDISGEVDRLFDDSSLPADGQPVAVIISGGVAAGKTTVRKQDYATGHVLIDAADIFLSLSRGEFFPFPEAFQEPMDLIGRLVAKRALSERRSIVTEIVGAEVEPVQQLIDALRSIGYSVQGAHITCDVEEAVRRNASRADDDISAYYAEPFQRAWITEACHELADSGYRFFGCATLREDGEICLQLRSEEVGRPVAEGYFRYKPDDPEYARIREHIGPIAVGEEKVITPFE